MYKLVVLAVIATVAQAGIIAAPYSLGAPLAAAPYGLAPAPLAAAPLAAAPLSYGLAPAPLAAAPAAYALPAPIAAPIAAAPAAYALPAAREIVEAPIVQQVVEKVEQHGYKIRY